MRLRDNDDTGDAAIAVWVSGEFVKTRGDDAKPGAPNQLTLRCGSPHEHVVETTAFYIDHQPGEHYEYRYGGGGGWGDPLERDPQKVLDDVLDEYVSIESAHRDYGVVLTGSLENLDLAIDLPATEGQREQMKAAQDPGLRTQD